MSEDKEIKKQKKEDARYLSSVRRAVKRVVSSVLEYIVIILIALFVASYLDSGDASGMFDFSGAVGDMLAPGEFAFDAIVGFLPLIVLSVLAVYFGEGSKERLAVSLLKYAYVAVWLYLMLDSAASSVELPSVATDLGLESIEFDISGIALFSIFVALVCMIIPIGEYIGAYKKHNEAVERKKNNWGKEPEEKKEEEPSESA